MVAAGWLAATGMAQEPWCPRLEGHWGWAGTYSVSASGGSVLFHSGLTLVLADWDGGPELRELGLGRVDGEPVDYAIVDTTAHVAVSSLGLQIFDLDAPAGPALLGTWRSANSPRGLAVEGGHAYVADGLGLRVVDVSDPQRPVEVAALGQESLLGGEDVELSGDYAFVAAGYELTVVDVRRPDDPVVVSSLPLDGYYPSLAIDGPIIWLLGSEPDLLVVDASDPLQPLLFGGYEVPGIEWDLDAMDGLVYVAVGPSGLQVIDGSDPERAELVATVDLEGLATGVSATKDGVLVATGREGVAVLETRVPSEPEVVATWSRPTPDVEAVDVELYDGLLVVADHSYASGRVRVLDPSDPRWIQELGFAPLPSDAVAVAVSPGLAMAAHVTLYVDIFVDGGLTTVDLVDPTDPTVLGTTFVDGSVSDVAASGTTAFMINDGELAVVDCSAPRTPAEIARYAPDTTFFRAVDVEADVAFLVGNYGTICAVGAADPVALVDLGCAVISDDTSRLVAVDVRDSLAAVIADPGGAGPDSLLLLDVSQPSNPIVLSEVLTDGSSGTFSPAAVELTGDLAVVSLGLDNGIRLYDISEPRDPVLVGERSSPSGGSHRMAVTGDRVFVTAGRDGVDGYRLGSCRTPRRAIGRVAP
jgi:hypothetical protein